MLHTSTGTAARSIAVVGAGLAGLTTTLHLARHLPSGQGHRIVLYDAQQRVGGWVRSDRMPVPGGKVEGTTATTALVEAGPRSIRPAGLPGLAMLDLVSSPGSGGREPTLTHTGGCAADSLSWPLL